MSVKSTVYISRQEAETMYKVLRSILSNEVLLFSNKELEDILEKMNDKYHGGEGFENYRITKDI
jgi:hypothetical protein